MKVLFKLIIPLLCIILPCLSLAQKSQNTRQVDQRPDLKISIEGRPMVYLRQSVVYKIFLRNDGEASAKAAELLVTLPLNLEYIKSTPLGKFKPPNGKTGGTISWQFAEIPSQEKIEMELTLRTKTVGRCRTSLKLSSRTMEGLETSPVEANLNLAILGVPAMHISSYDTEDPVEVGKTTTYVIEARNEGTSPCTNLSMKSILPVEMELVKCEGGGVSCKFENGQVLFDNVPFLAPGEKVTYKIHCRAIKPGSAKHRSILAYDQFTSSIIDEEGTSIYK